MKWIAVKTRRVFTFNIVMLLLLLPLQQTLGVNHAPVQNKVVPLGILDFSDESDTNAPVSLSRRLGQQLKQKLVAGFPDLLPKSLSLNSGPATAAPTIEQLVALGKQNAFEFVIKPGVLAVNIDETNLKAQLYAEIINVETGQRTLVRAEGIASSDGATPAQSIQWNNLGQGVTFATSAPGKALTLAVDQLASSIHNVLSAKGSGNSASQPIATQEDSAESSTSPESTPASASSPTSASDVTAAETNEEMQQLIAQAEQFVSNGVGNTEQIKAVHSAMDQLKKALAAKAVAVERGEDSSSTDAEIAMQKQSLQTAIQTLSEQAPQDLSGSSESIPASSEKKSLLGAIDQRAGEVIGILQKLQELRSVVRGASQDPSLSSSSADAQPGAISEESTEEVSGVVTEGGQPIAGVTVTDTETETETVTGTDGTYALKTIPGKLTMLALKKDGKQIGAGQVDLLRGHPAIADFEIKRPAANALGVIPATVVLAGAPKSGATGTLKGTANDKNGKPLARALISLDNRTLARTDSSGHYSFLKVPAGEHVITVRKSGLKISATKVSVTANKTSDSQSVLTREPIVNRVAGPALARGDGWTISGQVMDQANKPVAGALVQLLQQASVVSVRTLRNGAYEFKGLRLGTGTILVSKIGFENSKRIITPRPGRSASENFQLRSHDSAYVAKVIAARAKPMPLAQQSTRNHETPRVLAPTARAQPVTPEVERRAVPARLGQLRGRVIDAVSVAPIAGAVVAVSGRPTVVTGRDGSYSLSALPPGSYQVSISRAGFAEKRTVVTIRAAETTNADVRLTAINRKPSR